MITFNSITYGSNNLTNEQTLFVVTTIRRVLKDYLIPYSCALGIFLKVIIILVIVSTQFSRIFYKYIFVRNFCDLMHLMCGLPFQFRICLSCSEISTYLIQIYTFYLFILPFRIFSWTSIYIVIFLILNRYKVLSLNKTSLFINARSEFILLIILFLGFLIGSPSLLILKVEKIKQNITDTAPLYYSVYEKTLLGKIYVSFLMVIQFLLPIFLSIYLKHITVISYSYSVRKNIKIKKRDLVFTKIVLVITNLCLTSTFIDFVCSLLPRIYYYTDKSQDEFMKIIADTVRIFGYLCQFLLVGFESFVIFYYDKNLLKRKREKMSRSNQT